MTTHSSYFSSYTALSGNQYIFVANGSNTPVTDCGNHPPFSTLKSLFPVLFTKVSTESFHCDVCQFAKHHRTTFLPNGNKSSKPSPIPNISGAKLFVSFIDDCTRVTWIFLMKDKSEFFTCL